MVRCIPALAALLSLAACSGFTPGTTRPEARDLERTDRVSVQVACREAADRTLARQDRGQLIREDERNARLGAETGSLGLRTQFDQLGRQFRRDTLARDCERQNAPSAPDQPGATR